MEGEELRKISSQHVLVGHLVRQMGEEIYAEVATKKSLRSRKREIIRELNKLIKMATKEI